GSALPKQFCMLAGRPLLIHTVECFTRILPADDVLIVIDRAMDEMWKQICADYTFASPRIAYGGKSRTESLANALTALDNMSDDTIVMIHDGARPLATEHLVRSMMTIPEGCAGAIPAVAVTDTLRLIDGSDSKTVDRSRYVAVQPPQTFTLGNLRKSFACYREHSVTDDATLVQLVTGGRIAIVEGEHSNIKVTNPIDMAVAETLYRLQHANPECQ
ncbi:MAG: 2-C-methyl-D-erythritol 4-phosphate cytidylyltransferase, partial [Muribaculaceae bacterium]|nr:2-C-methyl-D-erythritol 4-phosphate cytidylyltransferase [Muribaculaceae bacterium]